MPSVLDEFILKLGVDDKELATAEQRIDDRSKRIKTKLKKVGDEVEANTKGTLAGVAEGLSGVAEAVEGAVAAVGLFKLGSMIDEFGRASIATSKTTQELGYLSFTLDTNVQDFSAWRNAVKFFGGTAEGATSSVQSLQSSLAQLYLTGQSSIVPYFRALGIGLTTPEGKFKTALDLIPELAHNKRLQDIKKQNPAFAASILSSMGLDQGSINAVLSGPDNFDATLARMKSLAPTNADKNAAVALQQSFANLNTTTTALETDVSTLLTPALTGLIAPLTAFETWLDGFLKKFNQDPGKAAGDVVHRAEKAVSHALGGLHYDPKGSPVLWEWPWNDPYYKSGKSGGGGGGANPLLGLIGRLEQSGNTQVSPKGAIGKYQIEPGTATQYGFDPNKLKDAAYNSMVASAILNDLWKQFHDIQAVLIAYNAGPGKARQWLKSGRNMSILPGETQRYLAHASRLGAIGSASRGGDTNVKIGSITVETQATDAHGVATALGAELGTIDLSHMAQVNRGMR